MTDANSYVAAPPQPSRPIWSLRSPYGEQYQSVHVVPSCLSSSQGGAYARGTALRGGTDVELVIFLDCFQSFGDQKTCHSETLGAM